MDMVHMRRLEDNLCELFLSFNMEVTGVKLRSSGFKGSAFTH